MNKFDKKIKEMAKEIQTPESYNQKVDGLLETLAGREASSAADSKGNALHADDKDNALHADSRDNTLHADNRDNALHADSGDGGSQTGGKGRRRALQLAFCLFCVFLILSVYTIGTQANFFSSFKETIIDFLTGGSNEDPEKLGVGSDQNYAESKPDLIMELSEKVIDSHSIYLLVTITAPNNIQFASNITFDYFCFCWGTNYNVDQLISGATSCELLEVSSDMPNRATYVVSLVTEEELEEEKDICVCFRDLTADPYSGHPTLLVSGVWSLTFPIYRTVTDNIVVECDSFMTFSYVITTAEVTSIELTPLGMVVTSDVSNCPADERAISDTTIEFRLKMIDGSEPILLSRDPEVDTPLLSSASSYFPEIDGKTYQQDTLAFSGAVDINKILGVYVEDIYIPVQ